ncbi:heavy metal-binding protein HIP-like isoform X1 [Ruditapes philippinarum]|uniref:heavy metal-binding protein HIP-like isoform X1 n=1 Tax=Ruditapes philippinarum TaxID=129788 RepID=UPI00295B6192|nr:heavy metal-binding protein HIP-like isoform X1 [Ruditapes philippinarum]
MLTPILIVVCIISVTSGHPHERRQIDEPICSKFDYEEKLLEKMIRMEMKMEKIIEEVKDKEKDYMSVATNLSQRVGNIENDAIQYQRGINRKMVEFADNFSQSKLSDLADFADLKIQHDEQIKSIAVLKEANANQETELKKLRQEINGESSEIKLINIKNRKQEIDIIGLKQKISTTSSEINTVNRKQDTDRNKLRQEIAAIKDKSLLPIVGFNARLSSTKTVSQGDKVVFEIVMINKGEGYDNSTGIFTAPYTGLYFFSVHVCSGTGSYVSYAIYQDGSQLTRSSQYDNYVYSCSSVSTIAIVNKDEQVWVQIEETSLFFTDVIRSNTFSGYLLNK